MERQVVRQIDVMENYSAIKNEEILPFPTTWINLEGIMLWEISQRKANTVSSYLYVESKNKKMKQNPKSDRKIDPTCGYQWRGWGQGALEEDGPKAQTSSYEINKY